jgi:hypothetical protein
MPRETPKYLGETYVHNFFTITFSYLSLYKLATYHWKDFEERYNFVVENYLIRIHMQK